jgi:hypothetical protein
VLECADTSGRLYSAVPGFSVDELSESVNSLSVGDVSEGVGATMTLDIPGTLTATGLTLPSDMAVETWLAVGERLKLLERSVQWGIGDWLNYGERSYGEMFSQALSEFDFERQTLENWKYTALHVEASRRRETLSFSHHVEVASQEPERQVELLDGAECQGWTVRELRKVVKGEVEKPVPLDGGQAECPRCQLRFRLSKNNHKEVR